MSDVNFNPQQPTVPPMVTSQEAPTDPPINNDSASYFDSSASVGNVQADFETAAEEIMANAEILEPEPEPLPNFEECIPQFEEDARDVQGDFEYPELPPTDVPPTNYDIADDPSAGDVQGDFDNSNINKPEVKENKLPEHGEKDGLMVKTNHAEKDGLLAKTEKPEKITQKPVNDDGTVNSAYYEELFSEEGSANLANFEGLFMSGNDAYHMLADGMGAHIEVPYRDGGYIATLEDGTQIKGNLFYPNSLHVALPDGQEHDIDREMK